MTKITRSAVRREQSRDAQKEQAQITFFVKNHKLNFRFESGAGSQFYQFNYGVKERRAVKDRMFR